MNEQMEESCCGQEQYGIEYLSDRIRQQILGVESEVKILLNKISEEKGDNSLQGVNVPNSRNANMADNATIAFRHLEDARMRIGKVMQAWQGGISILDRK